MLAVIIIFLALLVLLIYGPMLWRRRTLPPGPFPLPIVGNLLSLDPVEPHKTMVEWSKQYGGMITVWMANNPQVILMDHELMKDALTRHGDSLSNRVRQFAYRYSHNNNGITFSLGDRWREQRRFTLHLLRNFGLGRNIVEERILTRVKLFTNSIMADCKRSPDGYTVMDPKDPLFLLVGNLISSIVTGRTFDSPTDERKLLRVIQILQDQFVMLKSNWIFLLNSYSWLRFVPGFAKLARTDEIQKLDVEILAFLETELDAHKKRLATLSDPDEHEPNDFVEAYLQEIRRRQLSKEDPSYFDEYQLLSIMADLLIAGTDTTATTLHWGLLAVIKRPSVQDKVFNEIKTQIGMDRAPSLDDKKHMPYTMATLCEMQRWGNIFMINLSRWSEHDIDVSGGCKIPKGVEVIPQMWALHQDERTFPEPEQFRPERFLDMADGGRGTLVNTDRVAPFSMGKRQCVGESLAKAELFLIFVSLIQQFEFGLPPGVEEPGMEPDYAIIAHPRLRELMIKPRKH